MIQVALFEAKMNAFAGAGLATLGFTEFVGHYRARLPEPAFAALRPLLLMHDLFAGRLDDLRREVTPLGDGDPLWATYEGALAFLEGDNDRALERYRLGLKLLRKQQGKLFVPGIRGALFMMALLRTGDPAAQPKASPCSLPRERERGRGCDTVVKQRAARRPPFLREWNSSPVSQL